MARRLASDFYSQDTIQVAEGLLGQRLVRRLKDGTRLSGIIVETEAYLGLEDPACHSFAGRRTPRTEIMFGESGHSYIYFIYGFYFCMNVVTGDKDVPEAVLIRAIEPTEGIAHMKVYRPDSPVHNLANGPGKLCQSLHLNKAQNGLNLVLSSELWIEECGAYKNEPIIDGPRIGLGHGHDAVYWPLRFGIKGHPSLSPPKFPFGLP